MATGSYPRFRGRADSIYKRVLEDSTGAALDMGVGARLLFSCDDSCWGPCRRGTPRGSLPATPSSVFCRLFFHSLSDTNLTFWYIPTPRKQHQATPTAPHRQNTLSGISCVSRLSHCNCLSCLVKVWHLSHSRDNIKSANINVQNVACTHKMDGRLKMTVCLSTGPHLCHKLLVIAHAWSALPS